MNTNSATVCPACRRYRSKCGEETVGLQNKWLFYLRSMPPEWPHLCHYLDCKGQKGWMTQKPGTKPNTTGLKKNHAMMTTDILLYSDCCLAQEECCLLNRNRGGRYGRETERRWWGGPGRRGRSGNCGWDVK